MITYTELNERYRDIKPGDDVPSKLRKYKNMPEESDATKRLMHENREGVTLADAKHIRPYVANSNDVNPHEVSKDEKDKQKRERINFHSTMQRAIGRGSDMNNMSVRQSGHVFRGSAHDPRSMTDSNGLYTTNIPRSHSTHPGVAVSNAARNQTDSTHALHVTVLHHDNATGHRMFSTAGEGHGGKWHEEEVISHPAKYKITRTTSGGIHPKSGKEILYHHMHHVASHPSWDATKSGPLSEEEKKTAREW